MSPLLDSFLCHRRCRHSSIGDPHKICKHKFSLPIMGVRALEKGHRQSPPIQAPHPLHSGFSSLRAMASSEQDCPFCAIVKAYPHPADNSLPDDSEDASHIVLSTPHVLAFLDRLPLTKCHTIIIPRAHFELLSDIPSTDAAELGRALPIVCRAVLEVTGADGFNVIQNNGKPHERDY